MKRYIKLVSATIAITMALTALSACSPANNNQAKNNPTPGPNKNQLLTAPPTKPTAQDQQKEKIQKLNKQLTALLPLKSNYTWLYNGFAEYGHKMKLKSINRSTNTTTYYIDGQVEDMSGGESGRPADYYKLNITYTVKDGALTVDKTEKAMLDSKFDRMVLLKGPLAKGTKWTQRQVDRNTGKLSTIDSEITKVEEKAGVKTYTIKYKEKDSKYYEIRKIRSGTGILSFERLELFEDLSSLIGYYLYSEASGYNKK